MIPATNRAHQAHAPPFPAATFSLGARANHANHTQPEGTNTMSLSTIVACLAAWAHLQSCPPPAHKQDLRAAPPPRVTPAAARATRQDVEEVSLSQGYLAPAARFSGFYLGGSAGWGVVNSDQYLDRGNNHGAASVSPDGFIGALTAGYNFAIGEIVVAGLEADLGVMAISDDDKPVFDGHSWKPDYGPLWGTLRARIGFTLADSLLLYGTGGVAFMQTDSWTLGNNFNESSWDAKTRTGWVIGAGVEYALTERWSAKAEYLYMDFGKHHGQTEDGDPYWFDDSAHLFRLGVNYRF